MTSINCIVIDDEPFARKGLENYISKISFLQWIGSCENANESVELITTHKPDLLFLDIEIPYLNGVELLKSLNNPPKVIFTTAYEHYAIYGYELDVLDYLLKPIAFERFLKSANKAQEYFSMSKSASSSSIFIKVNGTLHKIFFDNVLYIEGMENYLCIYTSEKKLVTHCTIKSFLEKLPAGLFMQVHKSYIVALDKVTAVTPFLIKIDSIELPIGKKFKDNVLKEFMAS